RRIRASCDYLEPVAGPDEVAQCEQAHPSVDKAHRPPRCDRAIRLPRVNGSACKTRSEDLQIGRGVDIPHDEVRRAGEKSRKVTVTSPGEIVTETAPFGFAHWIFRTASVNGSPTWWYFMVGIPAPGTGMPMRSRVRG